MMGEEEFQIVQGQPHRQPAENGRDDILKALFGEGIVVELLKALALLLDPPGHLGRTPVDGPHGVGLHRL